MLRRPVAAAPFALACLSVVSPLAAAQSPAGDLDYAEPAHIAVVEGVAMIEREGLVDAARPNVLLLAGDRLRTERGRLEVLFPDRSALDLDLFTTIAVASDDLLHVLAGRVRLTIDGVVPDEPVTYRIDTPGGTIHIRTVGEYRVAITDPGGSPQVELAVVRGWADLATERDAVPVRAGQRAVARAGAPPSLPFTFNAAAWDAFDRWSDDRRAERLGAASTAHVPAELTRYAGTLDRYGTWAQTADVGYVWYPDVAADWRPYYHGSWSFVASFGWTWVGFDAWSWPTHHYGRWGVAGGRWYWIPGHRWGPAWVSWATAPGYVGWCPLGYDGWPVVGVSVYLGGRPHPYARHRPWTFVPHAHFGHAGRAVPHHAVAVGAIDPTDRGRFSARIPASLDAPRTRAIVSAGTRTGRAAPRAGVNAPTAIRQPAGPSAGAVASGRPTAVRRTPAENRTNLGAMAAQSPRARQTLERSSSDRPIRSVGQPRPLTDRGAQAGGSPSVQPTAERAGPRPGATVDRGLAGPTRARSDRGPVAPPAPRSRTAVVRTDPPAPTPRATVAAPVTATGPPVRSASREAPAVAARPRASTDRPSPSLRSPARPSRESAPPARASAPSRPAPTRVPPGAAQPAATDGPRAGGSPTASRQAPRAGAPRTGTAVARRPGGSR